MPCCRAAVLPSPARESLFYIVALVIAERGLVVHSLVRRGVLLLSARAKGHLTVKSAPLLEESHVI